MENIKIRLFEPADRDWLVAQHQVHYAREEGFDDTFGVLVAQIIDGFLDQHDPLCEAGWIACDGEKRLGIIFCVRLTEQAAKLRLFLLTPQARGQGVGRGMLAQCMRFAKDAGYQEMQLWTHESHQAAGALYAKTGWVLTKSKAVTSFGKGNVEQTWQITL